LIFARFLSTMLMVVFVTMAMIMNFLVNVFTGMTMVIVMIMAVAVIMITLDQVVLHIIYVDPASNSKNETKQVLAI
jgi:hypothetical protein